MRLLKKYDWLINYFYEKIKKTVDILRDKFMSFLETDNDYIKKYAERNRENISEDKAIGLIKARLNGDI